MDGFGVDEQSNVVVMGATNRFEVLDAALCRPGRFDRVVRVGLPDADGRCAILRVHLKATPCEFDLDVEMIGRKARGLSGAELAGLVNEAKIAAVREGARAVATRHLSGSLDHYNETRSSDEGKHGGGRGGGMPGNSMAAFLESLGVTGNGRNYEA